MGIFVLPNSTPSRSLCDLAPWPYQLQTQPLLSVSGGFSRTLLPFFPFTCFSTLFSFIAHLWPLLWHCSFGATLQKARETFLCMWDLIAVVFCDDTGLVVVNCRQKEMTDYSKVVKIALGFKSGFKEQKNRKMLNFHSSRKAQQIQTSCVAVLLSGRQVSCVPTTKATFTLQSNATQIRFFFAPMQPAYCILLNVSLNDTYPIFFLNPTQATWICGPKSDTYLMFWHAT